MLLPWEKVRSIVCKAVELCYQNFSVMEEIELICVMEEFSNLEINEVEINAGKKIVVNHDEPCCSHMVRDYSPSTNVNVIGKVKENKNDESNGDQSDEEKSNSKTSGKRKSKTNTDKKRSHKKKKIDKSSDENSEKSSRTETKKDDNDEDQADSSDDDVNDLNKVANQLAEFRSIKELPEKVFFKVLNFEIVETVNGRTVRIQLEDVDVDDGFFFVHLPKRFLSTVESNLPKYKRITSSTKPFYFAYLGQKGRAFKVIFTRNSDKL